MLSAMRTLLAVVTLVVGVVGAAVAQQSAALKIVVLEGEGGVNIIQQKTAVRPLIEVRDRNNLPVAGASVTFSIGGGGQGAAFAGGAQTLTVTTNAAGQAAASGLNAVSSGAFQIQVQAAYQGQVATAAISQTNFATAAAASQAGAGAGGGTGAGGATGGAAGGGGGVSATTVGIVGAAVGGGALAATQLGGNESDSDSGSDSNASVETYTGPISGQMIFTTLATNQQGQQTSCARTLAVGGSMRIELARGNATGKGGVDGTLNEVALTGNCSALNSSTFGVGGAPVSGGPSALTFTNTSPGPSVHKVVFTGSLNGDTINGTLSLDIQSTNGTSTTPTGFGSTTFPVTLRR
jgi:hypothetical protein